MIPFFKGPKREFLRERSQIHQVRGEKFQKRYSRVQTIHCPLDILIQMLEMRRQDSMAEEVVEEGGMRRNKLATSDKVSKGSTETLAMPKEKVNIIKQSSHTQPIQSNQIKKGSFKTPEFVLDKSLEDEEKETGVKKNANEKDKAIFDLGEVVEIEGEKLPEEVEVLKVKAGKKRQLESNSSQEQRTPVYQRLHKKMLSNFNFKNKYILIASM